ncbi:phosphoglucosamine mutase [Acidobacteriota bacterium]
MGKLFGTDGIRGKADAYPLDSPTVIRLGFCLAEVLGRSVSPVRVLLGRDSRESGARIAQCLAYGIHKAGGLTVDAGLIPTPGVAYLTRAYDFNAGIVISASHNPYTDNGIKVFSFEGYKIPDDLEEEIEKALLEGSAEPEPADLSKFELETDRTLRTRYLDRILSISEVKDLKGRAIKVAIDCSNGAASWIAPELFKQLGVDVIAMGNESNGKNINLDCGSLHPEGVADMVVKEKADLGIAYDGDADRCILIDEKGCVRDGDYQLALFADWMNERGSLPGREIVATVMSNLGLEKYLESRGISLLRTAVGDKNVLEEMIAKRIPVGGEQSGHIIFLDHATTGDGVLTSLRALEIMMARAKPLSQLCEGMTRFPQILKNIRVARKEPVDDVSELKDEINRVVTSLGADGRCFVRYSGTEPLLRIMIEGTDLKTIETYAEQIARVAQEKLG